MINIEDALRVRKKNPLGVPFAMVDSTPLAERLYKDHPQRFHSAGDAYKATAHFFQFIYLKRLYGDYESTFFEPSAIDDFVWRTAILDTRYYMRLCGALFIHHYPDGPDENTPAARAARLARTCAAYQMEFGRPYEEVVPPPVAPAQHVAGEDDFEHGINIDLDSDDDDDDDEEDDDVVPESKAFMRDDKGNLVLDEHGDLILVNGVGDKFIVEDDEYEPDEDDEDDEEEESVEEEQEASDASKKRPRDNEEPDNDNVVVVAVSLAADAAEVHENLVRFVAKTTDGQSASVHVQGACTITDLRYVIADTLGLPRDGVRLIYAGNDITWEVRAVSSYGFIDGQSYMINVLRRGN